VSASYLLQIRCTFKTAKAFGKESLQRDGTRLLEKEGGGLVHRNRGPGETPRGNVRGGLSFESSDHPEGETGAEEAFSYFLVSTL